ncbi:MAG: hypothetical protein ISN29_12485, partial [Gammaproteobacteria bacterium AqS3]|nr:hypothetical protein [Gammaproteobacteria bacterium AqS3]
MDENDSAIFKVRLNSEPTDEVTVTLSQPRGAAANSDVTIDTDDSTNGNQDELTFTA